MKRLLFLLSFCFFFVLMGTTTTSCSRKTGCPVNENAHIKPDRKGRLPSKRGKSTLFPKEMKKKRKKKKKRS